MKKSTINMLWLCAAVVAMPVVQADESHHGGKGGGVQSSPAPAAGKGMMGMGMMDEMHRTMERIQQSQDPAERQRLMDEHMKQMHKMMDDMHGMMGKEMDGKMMQKRMDMMQGMMEQMMGHMMAGEGAKQPGAKAEGAADEHDHKSR